jgi:alpha-1,6-mannosyltransferase
VQRPDARLNVLDVTKWFGETSGGVRTYLTAKREYVKRHPELRQVLVIPGPHDEITDDDGFRCYRLRGPRIPSQPQYRFLLATRSLRRIVAHERPDVIEVGSQIFVPWVVRLAARGTGHPLVGFYHGNLERAVCPRDDAGVWRRAAGALTRRYVRCVDTLFRVRIAASDSLAHDLRRAGVSAPARIPLGVDLRCFHPERRRRGDAVRVALGVQRDVPLVAYTGRIAPEKSLDVVIDAWDEVARRTGASLLIAGDGPLIHSLRSRAAGKNVRWVPFERERERIADILAAADVYIAPGAVETFGLAALEAMACGTPVLSADRGGVAELVTRSGAGGLFRAGDPESLAAAATTLLSSDLAVLGTRGRLHAEREHDWNAVFARLFDIYREVLST